MRSQKLHRLILATLNDRKADQIVTIDLNNKADFADAMVVASGTSGRHVASLAEHVMDALKTHGIQPLVEGLETGDWVLVDAGDIIIHIFKPEAREYYRLEKMWTVPALTSSKSFKETAISA